MVLIAVAVVAALQPVAPMPSHVAASSSAKPSLLLERPTAEFPVASVDGAPAYCAWRAGAAAPPFTWVLLDDEHRELARLDGLDATELPLDPELREHFVPGQCYHWFVVGQVSGQPLGSLLETVEIR